MHIASCIELVLPEASYANQTGFELRVWILIYKKEKGDELKSNQDQSQIYLKYKGILKSNIYWH
jgi:hypothetical protein